ncbi:hypothetical protein KCU83_g36, partial [Aureobasidium melanogenum]
MLSLFKLPEDCRNPVGSRALNKESKRTKGLEQTSEDENVPGSKRVLMALSFVSEAVIRHMGTYNCRKPNRR